MPRRRLLEALEDAEEKGKSARRQYLVELRKRIAVAIRSPDDGTRVGTPWSTLDQFRPWREVYAFRKRRKK